MSSEIEFKSTVTAQLLDVDGNEDRIVKRARVSTQSEPDPVRDEGLLRALVREILAMPADASVHTGCCPYACRLLVQIQELQETNRQLREALRQAEA